DVLHEELLGVLAALAQLLAFVGVPGAALLHDALVDRDVEHAALTRDALSEDEVELGLTEWRRTFVLHHLGPYAVADVVGPVLDGLHAPDVDAHRRVELQRPTTRGGLR